MYTNMCVWWGVGWVSLLAWMLERAGAAKARVIDL